MRVYNKQQGYSESGGEFKDSKEAEKRQQLFRQNKKVGQEVQGTVLRPRGEKVPGQAWLDVGGLPLSAQLPFEAQPGQRLLLRIESLEPEIVLKFLKEVHAASAGLQIKAYTTLGKQLHNSWQNFWHNLLELRGGIGGIGGIGELGKFAAQCPNGMLGKFTDNPAVNFAASPKGNLLPNLPGNLDSKLLEVHGFKQLQAWAKFTSLITEDESFENLNASPANASPASASPASASPANSSPANSMDERVGMPSDNCLEFGEELQAGKTLALGDPLPAWLVNAGEKLVCNLHKIWSEKFIGSLSGQTQKELAELNSIQLSTVRALEVKGVRGWSQIPWASPTGSREELLILRPKGQKLAQVFISGTWPGLGGVFVNAMAFNGQISCRVQVQNLLPLEQVVQIINLPGLGKIFNLVAAKYNIASEALASCVNLNSQQQGQAQNKVICLELKQHPPDTVPGILLRL